jgi:hypothetical protein
VADLRSSFGADSFVIGGDFNIDRFNRLQPREQKERILLKLVNDLEVDDGFQFVPNNSTPTYVDAGSTLDYIGVSGDLYIRKWEVEVNGLCQHLPVSIELSSPVPLSPQTLPFRLPNLRFYDREVCASRDLLKLCVSGLGLLPVDTVYEKIESCFVNGSSLERPSHFKNSSSPSSWWRLVPHESRVLIATLEEESRYIFESWMSGDGAFSLSEVVEHRRHANRVNLRVRREADVALQREMGKDFPNQALCWKILRKIRKPVDTVSIDIGTLTNHFSRIFHRRDRPLHFWNGLPGVAGETMPDENFLDEPFTDDELVRALKDLNGGAATGPERVPSAAIKEVFRDAESRVPLLLLMNACWQEGRIPRSWGETELFILYKGKGSRSLADNYRAIALSNDFRRIYERLVGARLRVWINRHEATGNMQFGFKRGSSTFDAIFVLRTALFHCTRVLCRPACAVFVDIRKAFPSTSRVAILETFERNRVPTKITKAMAALLSGSTSRLRVNGRLTDQFPVTSGTPEGSINSPDFFAVVYAEIFKKIGVHELQSDLADMDPDLVYYIIFADDVTFFGMNTKKVMKATEEFKRECPNCDLEVNSKKTKCMSFVPPGPSSVQIREEDWQFVVDGEVIEHVDEFMYLGYCLDTTLSEKGHMKLIRERLMKAARAVGQVMRDMKCSSLISLRRYFLSLVASQLYGAIFIDPEGLDYELAAGIFFKTALGLADSFPSAAAMSILGLKPFEVTQESQRMRFILKAERKTSSPVFACIVHDRCVLFPLHVGLNACLGRALIKIEAPRTLDFSLHFDSILRAIERREVGELRARLLVASGRAFWTELAPDGFFSQDLQVVLSSLPFEQLRVCILFFTDTLRWSADVKPRFCDLCKCPFTVEHFFSCRRPFLSGRGWATFMALCANGSWIDLVECVFDVLKQWANATDMFRPNLRVSILAFEPFDLGDAGFNPFRLNY